MTRMMHGCYESQRAGHLHNMRMGLLGLRRPTFPDHHPRCWKTHLPSRRRTSCTRSGARNSALADVLWTVEDVIVEDAWRSEAEERTLELECADGFAVVRPPVGSGARGRTAGPSPPPPHPPVPLAADALPHMQRRVPAARVRGQQPARGGVPAPRGSGQGAARAHHLCGPRVARRSSAGGGGAASPAAPGRCGEGARLVTRRLALAPSATCRGQRGDRHRWRRGRSGWLWRLCQRGWGLDEAR
jgi:hypothetical protein